MKNKKIFKLSLNKYTIAGIKIEHLNGGQDENDKDFTQDCMFLSEGCPLPPSIFQYCPKPIATKQCTARITVVNC